MNITKYNKKLIDNLEIEFNTKEEMFFFLEEFKREIELNELDVELDVSVDIELYNEKIISSGENHFIKQKEIINDKYKTQLEKVKNVEIKLKEFDESIIERVSNESSKTKKCKNCGSVINKEYIKNVNCPICQENFTYTETDLKRYNSLIQKLEKETEKTKELEENILSKDKEEDFLYKINIFNLNIYLSFVILDIVEKGLIE